MTFFEKLKNLFFGNTKFAKALSGEIPIYSQFGQNIYASDVVQQAIQCIVAEITKLQPTHVIKKENDIVPKSGNIQNILNNPNSLMTTVDFLEKVVWNYFFNYNSFIVPHYESTIDKNGIEKRRYIALYPIRPIQVDFLQDSTNRYFIKVYFENNQNFTLPYEEIIHIRKNYSINDYMGGNNLGQPDNVALIDTLDLNKQLLDGIKKVVGASTNVNGIVKIKSIIDKDGAKKELEKFNEILQKNKSGIIPMDISTEYVPINRVLKFVDNDTLKFIDNKILRHFGVPLNILTGDFTKEQYEAFYQKTLEPLIKRLGQAFTKTLFTQREKGFGNEIVFYPKELLFMNTSQTLELVRMLGDSGALYENEKRVAFGLKPLAELENVRMQSLNYVNVKNADKYQMGDNTDRKEEKNKNFKINERCKEIMENKIIETNQKETRSFNFEIRANKDENKGTFIEGRPIVYNSKTDIGGYFEEVIDSGAISESALKDVRFLVNHDFNKLPLARSRNNNKNSTMHLSLDEKGLSINVKLDTENNADARSLYSAVERGDITGMSFAFEISGEKWENLDSDYPTRHITKISQVWEVSAVTFPAYEDTSINTRSKEALDNARKSLLENRDKALDSERELDLLKLKSKYL